MWRSLAIMTGCFEFFFPLPYWDIYQPAAHSPPKQDSTHICECFVSHSLPFGGRKFLLHIFSSDRIWLFASQHPQSLPMKESRCRTQPYDEHLSCIRCRLDLCLVLPAMQKQCLEPQNLTHHPDKMSPGWGMTDQKGQRTINITCLHR